MGLVHGGNYRILCLYSNRKFLQIYPRWSAFYSFYAYFPFNRFGRTRVRALCFRAVFGHDEHACAACKVQLLPSLRSSSVEIIPKKEDKTKSRLTVTSLGGIFFNFLFIALGFVALFVPQVPIWISPIAVFHLSLFFDNALPIAYKAGKSDGLVISGLIKNTPESRVMLAVLKVQAHILAGKPIAEVDKTYLFGLPQIAEDDPAFISLCELRAKYSEAVGDTQNAAVYRARFEELKKEYLG